MASKSTTVRIVRTAARFLSRVAPPLAARLLARLFVTPRRRRVAAHERAAMASASRSHVIVDGGRRLPVYAWGEGPTVLLVHGWSSRASQLAPYVAPLTARGYRVVAFDQPAHGEAEGRLTHLPDFANAIAHVARAVGPLRAVVAHSIGAAATTLAVSRGVSVERLVYLAPPENLPGYLARLARFVGFSPRVAALAQRRLEGRLDVPFERARGSFLAPAIDIPLLLVHDEGDVEVPFAEGRDLERAWAGPVRLHATGGLGHNRIVRSPPIVEAVVDFVAGGLALHDPGGDSTTDVLRRLRRDQSSTAPSAGSARSVGSST